MGATPSVYASGGQTTQEVMDTPTTFPPNSSGRGDAVLREVLRNLQLSPDLVDKSAAAIYAHVRDPVDHPVDKELARLCASEYTRGALYALCLYLVAASAFDKSPASAKGGRIALPTLSARDVGGGIGNSNSKGADAEESGNSAAALTESVSGRLSTLWNRLRRTRSMPSKGVILPTEEEEEDQLHDAATDLDSPPAMMAATPAKLRVRVGVTPRSSKRPGSLLSGLGLGSPSGRAAGDIATPRRAPVRTGHWKLGHEIGKGSFGAVHIGLNEDTGDLIAVKQLSLKNADQAEELYTEIDLMRQLTHPNIVCYLGAEVNDNEKTISIFQEWVPGSVTTLLVNFGPFSDHRIAGYTKQILQGLVYLHSERVIHRDIKGGNILIDDRGVVKLCDFGASKLLDAESFTGMGDHTRVGSPLFMAPEILLRQDYGPQVDIWSLGGAVLEMATGQPPWHTLNLRTPVALINWVKRTEGPPPLPEGLSSPLTRFLLRCFERDPGKRATAKELLSDPFVAKHRGERALLPKGSEAASDADSVVSDIDNLSRTAAIARIRRASLSDYSRPDSGHSARSAPSPRASADRAPGAQQPGRHPSTTSGGGGGGFLTDLAQQVVAKLGPAADEAAAATAGDEGTPPRRPGSSAPLAAGDGGTPPRRPGSSRSAMTPPLRVEMAGLEPSSGSPSRVASTPPAARRLSLGRNSLGAPNPFGGRRRSLDTSLDGARGSSSRPGSPRAGVDSPRAGGGSARASGSPRASDVAPVKPASCSDGLRQDDDRDKAGGEGSGGSVVNGAANKAKSEDSAMVVAAVGRPDAGEDALRMIGGDDARSNGSCNIGSSRSPARDSATVPASENLSSAAAAAAAAETETPARAPLNKQRSGRGGRPGGGAFGDSQAVPPRDNL